MADEAEKTPAGDVARRLRVHGLVQGVYYRFEARRAGSALGLTGWVTNRRDGSVEVFAQGPPERVEELIAWCGEGPRGARVERVDVEDAALDARLTGFGIR